MKDYFYLNPSEMLEISRKLTGSEMKMLLAMMYCMSSTETDLFINNKENRQRMEEIDFKKTPERICILLSSLVKKEVIKREANAVYSLSRNLFRLAEQIPK